MNFNTDAADGLIELRYQAIAENRPPQTIDCLDRAENELVELRAENVEQQSALEDAREDRNNLLDELSTLIKAFDDAACEWEEDKGFLAAYKMACSAIERYS